MTAALQKYKLYIIIAVLLIMAAMASWIIISRNSTVKIPSKGVFVINTIMEEIKCKI